MSWRDALTGLVKPAVQLVARPAVHRIYTQIPAARTTLGCEEGSLKPGKHYVRIKLIQMFLGYEGVWVQNRAPIVHAFPRFLHNQGYLEMPIILGPGRLRDFSGQPLQRVISLNQTIAGPWPYLGGEFDLLLVLFAAKTQNYAENLLDIFSLLSSIVPNVELKAAVPFLRSMEHGLEGMLDLGDLNLRVGIQDTFSSPSGGRYVVNPLRSGYRVLIAKEINDIDPEKLWVTDRGLCRANSGEPGDLLTGCDYIVFRIEQLETRDWRELPSLDAAWNKVENAVETGDKGNIDRAYDIFKGTLLGSADLLVSDRCRVLNEQTKVINELVQAGRTQWTGLFPEQAAEMTPDMMELRDDELIQATQLHWAR